MISSALTKAYTILETGEIDRNIIEELSRTEGEEILDLVSLANKVKNKFSPEYHACTIMNAKSGICSEDCRFCAQSAHHDTGVDTFPLETKEAMIKKAEETFKTGVPRFGIVTSGTGYNSINDEFMVIIDTIKELNEKYPDKYICASLGNLTEETASKLAECRVAHYNINIQTNPAKYGSLISTTHTIESKIETIKLLQKYNIKVCCGGIIGLGETMSDRIDMAYALKELDVEVIPINVLIPIDGTPLEGQPKISAAETARTFALFRLINPRKLIKFAAGRETVMRDFQGMLMLAGANGFITGGYLTTRGREVEDDVEFTEQLKGFK